MIRDEEIDPDLDKSIKIAYISFFRPCEYTFRMCKKKNNDEWIDKMFEEIKPDIIEYRNKWDWLSYKSEEIRPCSVEEFNRRYMCRVDKNTIET